MHISDPENQTVRAVRNIELCVKMVPTCVIFQFCLPNGIILTLILKVRNMYRTRKLELCRGMIYFLDS